MCALVCLPRPIAVSYSEISRHLDSAVEKGEINKIKQLINLIADELPVPAIFNGYSLLCKAIEFSQPEAAEVLLDYIVSKDTKTPLHTAVHYAVLDNNYDITKLMILRGANLNKKADVISKKNIEFCGDRYATIFYRISEKCLLTSEEIILQQYTPLNLAVKNNNIELIELLIHFGAHALSSDSIDNSIIDVAIKNHNLDLMKLVVNSEGSQSLLEKFEDLKHSDDSYQFAEKEIKAQILSQAINCNENEQAIELIKSGVDVDIEDRKRQHTVLMNAMISQNLPIIETLLYWGADVNAWTIDGYTAMHYLFMTPFINENGEDITLKVAELFVSRGVDFNIATEQGMTPLSLVPYHAEKVQFLLENNANINLQLVENGLTPFMETVYELQEFLSQNNSEEANNYRDSSIKIKDVFETALVFVKHIVKMLSKNQLVSPQNLEALESCKVLTEFRDKCFKEVQDMKTVIAGKFVTLFNFWVTDDLDQLIAYVCNRDFIDYVTNSEKFFKRFSIYSSDIRDKWNQCLARKNFMDLRRNLIAKL